MLNHADTRTRGADDRRFAFGECAHEIQRHRAAFVLKAIVEERLAAAGLLHWKDEFYAQALEEPGHVLERRSIELVAEAGNKQLSFWHDG